MPYRLFRNLPEAGGRSDRQSRAEARALRRALTIPDLHPAPDLFGLDLAGLRRIAEALEALTGGSSDLWQEMAQACITGDREKVDALSSLIGSGFLNVDQIVKPNPLTGASLSMIHTLVSFGGRRALSDGAIDRMLKSGADAQPELAALARGSFATLDEHVSHLAESGADLDASISRSRSGLQRDLRRAGKTGREIGDALESLGLGAGAWDVEAVVKRIRQGYHLRDEEVPKVVDAFASPLMRALLDGHAGPGGGAKPPSLAPGAVALIRHGADIDAAIPLKALVGTRLPLRPIHAAARFHGVEVVQALVDRGVDRFVEDEKGDTALHLAARRPDGSAVVEALLARKGKALLDMANHEGASPLHAACYPRGNLGVVEGLIGKGADPLAVDREGATPLHHAAEVNGNAAVVRALLAAGADPLAVDGEGATPLHRAAEVYGNAAVVRALLEAGADPSAVDREGATPLHRAVEVNDDDAVVRALLAAGADPLAVDGKGATPLHRAARGFGNAAVVPALLAAAPPGWAAVQTKAGETVLHVATTHHRNLPIVRELLARGGPDALSIRTSGTDPDETPGRTPLHHAIFHARDVEMVRALIEAFRPLASDGRDEVGRRALDLRREQLARAERRVEELSRRGGAAPEPEPADGAPPGGEQGAQGPREPSWVAVARRDWLAETLEGGIEAQAEKERGLLAERAPRLLLDWINQPDAEGKTALHLAVDTGESDLVEVLIEAGADVDGGSKAPGSPNAERRPSPLLAAIRKGEKGLVTMLLEAGARLSPEDGAGEESAALKHISFDQIQALLDTHDGILTRGEHRVTSLLQRATKARLPAAMVEMLLEVASGDDIATPNRFGEEERYSTILHRAAGHPGNHEVVNLILARARDQFGPDDLGGFVNARTVKKTEAGQAVTALEIAVAEPGNLETVRSLIAAGGGSDLDPAGLLRTLLSAAARASEPAVVDALVSLGAPLDGKTAEGSTVMHAAAESRHTAVVQRLLDLGCGAQVTVQDAAGIQPLHVAAENGTPEAIEMLLRNGAAPSVDAPNPAGRTPLHLAAQHGMPDAARILLEHGAARTVNRATQDGITPLHVASEKSRLGAVRLLLEHGADIDRASDEGLTPLMAAVVVGGEGRPADDRVEVVRALLESGAKADARSDGVGALHAAVAMADVDPRLIELLVAHGAAIDDAVDLEALDPERGSSLATPSQIAAMRAKDGALRKLLELGADPSVQDAEGATLLHLRLRADRCSRWAAAGLIDAGVDVEAGDAKGDTALHALLARADADLDVARLLLDSGADVDAENSAGDTALHVAARSHRPPGTDVVDELLRRGADVRRPGGAGMSALLEGLTAIDRVNGPEFDPKSTGRAQAVLGEGLPLIQRLLEGGASVEEVDAAGRTALHIALGLTHLRDPPLDGLVRRMLERGADLLVVDHRGRTAVDIASEGLRRALGDAGSADASAEANGERLSQAETVLLLSAVIEAGARQDRALRDGAAPAGERLRSLKAVLESLAAADPEKAPVDGPRLAPPSPAGEGEDGAARGGRADPGAVAEQRKADGEAFARSVDRALSAYKGLCNAGLEGDDLALARDLVDEFPPKTRPAARAALARAASAA